MHASFDLRGEAAGMKLQSSAANARVGNRPSVGPCSSTVFTTHDDEVLLNRSFAAGIPTDDTMW